MGSAVIASPAKLPLDVVFSRSFALLLLIPDFTGWASVLAGRRLRRNCVIRGRCEPQPVQSTTCNLVYVLTPRVSRSTRKSVGTSRGDKLTKIPYTHPSLAWSLSRGTRLLPSRISWELNDTIAQRSMKQRVHTLGIIKTIQRFDWSTCL